MADGCDDARQIDELARLVERGVAVAAASRYMAGGQQVGGPGAQGHVVPGGGPLTADPGPRRNAGRHQLVQGVFDRVRARRSASTPATASRSASSSPPRPSGSASRSPRSRRSGWTGRRRPRPGTEGAQGPGPAAHPRLGRAGPALHLRRGSRGRHRDRDGAPRRPQRGLQPVHRREHDRARAGRGDLAQDQGGRRCRCAIVNDDPFTYDVQRRVPGRREGQASSSASRRRPAWTRCWTRSSRGSATRSKPAPSEPDLSGEQCRRREARRPRA